MTRIVIADDHAIVRRGLKDILATCPDMVVAAECNDGQELLKLIEKEDFDLVLLDLTMPGRNGFDIYKQLKVLKPALPVLVLTMHPEKEFAIRAFKVGVNGYITKESAPNELVAAIRKVTAGGKYISSSLAEKLVISLGQHDVKLPHELLSDREFQILRMIVSGKSIKGIANELSLSPRTVSTYRTRILTKMHLASNVELHGYAMKNGLVDQSLPTLDEELIHT